MFSAITNLWARFVHWLEVLFDEEDVDEPVREVRDLPPVDIVPRSEWGAREPSEELEDLNIPVTAVIFHHTVSPTCTTKEECCRMIRKLQDAHMDKLGWPDIGYNFMIGGDARVYEGRGWTKEGAHTDQWNHKSIGVAAIGDYTEEPPSEEMLEAIEQLVSTGLKGYKYLKKEYSALGHNQMDVVWNHYTCTCPGDAFYEEIKYMPHWNLGGEYIEAKPAPSDFDSLSDTEFYMTDQYESESDYPKGYNEDIFGPDDPEKPVTYV